MTESPGAATIEGTLHSSGGKGRTHFNISKARRRRPADTRPF